MNAVISDLYANEKLAALSKDVDADTLSRKLNSNGSLGLSVPLDSLSVAAHASLYDTLGSLNISQMIRDDQSDAFDAKLAAVAFGHWRVFLDAKCAQLVKIDVENFLGFSVVGLLSRRVVEVRNLLRADFCRSMVDSACEEISGDWLTRVRCYITLASLILVRQEYADDIADASKVINELSLKQKEFEKSWLEKTETHVQTKASILLAYYHLAHATIRTAEYLGSGILSNAEGGSKNVVPELRRLLDKAERFVEASKDFEAIAWVQQISTVLWFVQSDSIWSTSKGTSKLIDDFVNHVGTSKSPIFSLLPSQQDALKQNFLDPNKVAMVLQMPTSAGKTLLAEFAILQVLGAYQDDRVVYLTPTRALATQVRKTLAADFRPIKINVYAASSAFEEDPYELNLLRDVKGVVVSTPEKLDLMLRSHAEWFKKVRLVIVDEAHLLNEGERGVRLELLLANIRREQPHASLLLLTPFVDNAAKIADWLGGRRSHAIEVKWRPSRIIVGIADFSRRNGKSSVHIEWREPHQPDQQPKPTVFQVPEDLRASSPNREKVVSLARKFSALGLSLAMFPGRPLEAEKAAKAFAETRDFLKDGQLSRSMRVAIALAESEYGESAPLANCLRKGVAFHHSALSGDLRYLIEDLAKHGQLSLVAATTTLAQGINFPVSSVIVHSVSKSSKEGDLSPGEFWNIAGRAGRVGLADKGVVIFANRDNRKHWEHYTNYLSQQITSALTQALIGLDIQHANLKEEYRNRPGIRPFIQYLAHSAARLGPKEALAELQELLEASLASVQITSKEIRRNLSDLAECYLKSIIDLNKGYLKTADASGLGSFSFQELYAKVKESSILMAGPGKVLASGENGIGHLINALAWLPELNLALENGSGKIDIDAIARVVTGWINGRSVAELSREFSADEEEDKIRQAGRYLFSTVSQTISWGAHAYTRGWLMATNEAEVSSEGAMLASYIQHGVSTPEAAVASMLGVPRQVAEAFGDIYKRENGPLIPEQSSGFRQFVEDSTDEIWESALLRSRLKGKIDAADLRATWAEMQGMH